MKRKFTGSAVTKSVSIDKKLLERVDKKLARNPETDFSKYVRGLIREDVSKVAA